MTTETLPNILSRFTFQILTMSSDEDIVFATIAAVSQAKMGLYSPLLEDASNNSSARTLAKMLVKEEKKVLCDLRQQLMSVVSRRVHFRCAGEAHLGVKFFSSQNGFHLCVDAVWFWCERDPHNRSTAFNCPAITPHNSCCRTGRWVGS